MPDRVITLRLPDGFDRVMREHANEQAAVLSDDMRRIYIATLLAAIMDGLKAPGVADAFVRLNGGPSVLSGNHDRLH
jgi:hypothetical protein